MESQPLALVHIPCEQSQAQEMYLSQFWEFLQIEDGIKAFKDVKSRIVTVSSAAVERNAIIGDDAEARKKDIPIVQLNPGGILNYKYMGENAVRSSGLPYTVVRPVGRVSAVTFTDVNLGCNWLGSGIPLIDSPDA